MDVHDQNCASCSDKSTNLKPDLSAISLTHVQYIRGDLIGYVLAWFSLVPFCILVALITLIIFRRDLHTASYFFGLLLNEIINWVLKHCIRERRPQTYFSVLYSEYGMPSSHSQFMFFFSTYMLFFLFIRVHRNYNWVDDIWKYVTGLGFIVCSCLVAYSRIYLGYHTSSQVLWGGIVGAVLGCVWFTSVQTVLTPFFPYIASRIYLGYHTSSQVLWGGIVGAVLGCVWFTSVQTVLTPFFPYIASCPLGEFLMVRDSTLIPHVLWFEYTSSRSESRSRQRKMTSRKSQ